MYVYTNPEIKYSHATDKREIVNLSQIIETTRNSYTINVKQISGYYYSIPQPVCSVHAFKWSNINTRHVHGGRLMILTIGDAIWSPVRRKFISDRVACTSSCPD